MRFTTLSDWLSWLESCHPKAIELGLERVAAVAGRMGLDFSSSKVITIGGTNGKGSCVAALNALCLEAGLNVGCYTSPHLLRYNERISVNGHFVSDEQILAAFDRVDRARESVSLTYFEFGTLAALEIFQRAALDIVVLEVGLGGRLDAVNIVDADIAVVVTVALDHQDWLGSDRESIGVEKAGIFRSGRPAICADDDPPKSLLSYAESIGAELQLRHRNFDLSIEADGGSQWWSGDSCSAQRIVGLEWPSLPIPSLAAALQVAELLAIDRKYWHCLSQVKVAGRYQRTEYCGRSLLLDVAHNPAAAELLAQRLANEPVPGKRCALFAVMADKDIAHMIEPLRHTFAEWWVVGLPGIPRAAKPEVVADIIREQVAVPVRAFPDSEQVCELIPELLSAQDQLVVFGSFFTVAAVLSGCLNGVE